MTAGAGLCATPAQAQEESALQRVKRTGRLTVAIYHDLPPFHVKGKGIGVDLGAALAAKLGVQLSLLPFAAGENMEDDLRNMVWRGHYLGFGPADVLLHVPVALGTLHQGGAVLLLSAALALGSRQAPATPDSNRANSAPAAQRASSSA